MYGWMFAALRWLDGLEYPALMPSATCAPCQARAMAAAPPATPEALSAPGSTRWSGVLAVENQVTGDMPVRVFRPNALSWEQGATWPLSIVFQAAEGHDNSVVAGTIDTITRGQKGLIEATGTFDMGSANGQEAARMVAEGVMKWVSVDLDDVALEVWVKSDLMAEEPGLLAAAGDPLPSQDGYQTIATLAPDDEIHVITAGRIRGATLVHMSAFADAQIHVESPGDAGAAGPQPGMGGTMPDGSVCSCDEADADYDPACQCQDVVTAAAKKEPVSDKPWSNFTQADYNEEQWYRACALHKNGSSRAKSDNGLPIREPDGTLNRNGVHNAAARFNQVQAPQAAKDAAAATLRGAYATLGEDPPPAIAASAAMTAAAPALTRPAEPRPWAVQIDPPARFFSTPRLHRATPLTITDEGWVYGHVFAWGTCHIAYTNNGECILPPPSPSHYAHYHTGSILTAERSLLASGRVTLGTVHASKFMTAAGALAHYEDTGLGAVDARMGEDTFGGWIGGGLRPKITREQVRELRASPLSGDWRRIGGALELIAVLAVNVAGFPIPRPEALVAGGQVQSLTAAGMIQPGEPLPREQVRTSGSRFTVKVPKRPVESPGDALARRVAASKLAMRVHHPVRSV